MKKFTFALLPLIFFVSLALAQQTNETAKENFKKYLDGKIFMSYAARSLPTLEECKLIFKGTNADSVYEAMQEMEVKLAQGGKGAETFADVRAESFTTEEMLEGKPGVYTGGMKRISEKINPKITFYKISYLRTVG
ncbi:MAG: hypothetical protein IAF38_02025, partial [Bacteroidia bacterium]|nr:hypothetical protein [Bacteroidia bacterium]